jgi:hypothetical protein
MASRSCFFRVASRIHDHRAGLAHRLDAALDQRIDLLVGAEVVASHADARTLQPVAVEEAGMVGVCLPARALVGRIARIDSGQRAQHDRGIGHGARQRTDHVLAVRARHHAGAGAAGQDVGVLGLSAPRAPAAFISQVADISCITVVLVVFESQGSKFLLFIYL